MKTLTPFGKLMLVCTNQEDFNVEDNEFTEKEVGCQSCGCTYIDEVELEWHMTAEYTA